MKIAWRGLWWSLVSLVGVMLAGAATPLPVQMVSDPPPAIDGNASRLLLLEQIHKLERSEQVMYGQEMWKGAEDLSASVAIGYDRTYLYLAALVKDDRHRQEHYSGSLWKGDHVMLLVDYPVQEGVAADLSKVYRLGFSPGNFAGVAPEAYMWNPMPGAIPGVRLGAVRTADGYQLEAAVPWAVFGVVQPEEGMSLSLDVLVSDSDTDDQDKVMALSPHPGRRLNHPERLLPAVLANANGTVDPAKIRHGQAVTAVPLTQIAEGEQRVFALDDAVAAGARELRLLAVLTAARAAGATYGMRVEFNGTPLDHRHLRNRGERIEFGQHIVAPVNPGGTLYVPYAPDFNPDSYLPVYSNGQRINPYEYRFDIGDLVKPAGNTVTVRHAQPLAKMPLAVEIALSHTLSPPLAAVALADAPTGAIPVFVPRAPAAPDAYVARLTAGGAIAVTVHGESCTIDSAFSTRTPGWAVLQSEPATAEWTAWTVDGLRASGTTAEFRLERRLTLWPGRIQVIDTVTNLTGEDLPLMYRHDLAATAARRIFIGGREIKGDSYRVDSGSHPASLFLTEQGGIGLLAEDDYTRAQGDNFLQNGRLGLGNPRLVLTPGRTAEIEFSVYPLEEADSFTFINRVRETWGNNFTIDGSACFTSGMHLASSHTAESFRDYMHNKSMRMVMAAVMFLGDRAVHGGAWQALDKTRVKQSIALSKQADPQAPYYVYYHCFISNGEGDSERYADDAAITSAGAQADYGRGFYPIFIPREGSPFAKLQEELIALRFAAGADAIYWDEMAYSKAKYDYNSRHWDGVTGNIDPKTHRLQQKISCVTLATLPWRVKVCRMIIEQSRATALGRPPMIGNGAPLTRTFNQFKIPRFIETGSITNLVLGQLYTPIALGDHLSEKDEVDCYKNMVRGLDYGALYYWYSPSITPSRPTLTEAMFPITPINLGHGFIIGQERILTNRSGLFGWNDTSTFTVQVYDRMGRRDDKTAVPRVIRDGKAYAEVRIPEGYSAAIIRRP